jgi:C1A family cysteine protease
MRAFVIFCVGISLALACEQQFTDFKLKYSKVYTPEIENYRKQVFCDNLNTVTNMQNPTYGVTKFFDLTPAEFKYRYLNYRPRHTRLATDVFEHSSKTHNIPQSFDWRTHGVVTNVKDQGQCGSCWAFSAIEELESCYARKGNNLTELSPQQIVSCDRGGQDFGCMGGDTVTAFTYMAKAGLQTEKSYPYVSGSTGQDEPCKYNKSDVLVHMKNFTYATKPCFDGCDKQDEHSLIRNMVFYAPVSICVAADTWMSYVSGIIEDNCPHKYDDLDHCTQIVGYNTDSKGLYWIVRNSWGTDWGEKGYINIRFGQNLCGLADEATFVLF